MARKKKLIKIRKPKLRITKKGVKVSKPSARVGGKLGVNVSSKGVSGSVRTGKGHVNVSKKGVRGRVGGQSGVNFGKKGLKASKRKSKKSGCLPGCGSVLVFLLLIPITGIYMIKRVL